MQVAEQLVLSAAISAVRGVVIAAAEDAGEVVLIDPPMPFLAGAWFGGRPPGDDGRHRPD